MLPAAILDIDGTLVDTNYHHVLAWYRALRANDIRVPMWRIHRHIGMGGDHLVEALTDAQTEARLGDDVRAAENELYGELLDEVQVMPGAVDLLEGLQERGHEIVLASSAKQEEVEHYVDLLQARDVVAGWTSAGDVDATKPEPDLVQTALDRTRSDRAAMVGDSTWDCEAARRAGIETIAVLTGGFSEQELGEAGAVAVFPSLIDLLRAIDDTPLS